MKTLVAMLVVVFPLLAFAQASKKAQEVTEDIAAHRAIAAAHEKAAKCFESGKGEKECQAHLAADCKGIAIGRYCGMKHKH